MELPSANHPENQRHDQRKPRESGIQSGTSRARKSNSGRTAEALAEIALGKFRVGKVLGRGGSGVVRVATDAKLRRELAIKMLTLPGDRSAGDAPAARDSSVAVTKFIEEAQITGQLQHPNIVPVYELGEDADGRPFLAMKCVRGKTLTATIRDAHEQALKQAATPAEVASMLRRLLDIFLKACDAIAYAHSRGVIHRDIKPDNIMVGKFGDVLVMDWGLAKPLSTGADAVSWPTAPTSETPTAAGADALATQIIISDRRESGMMTLHGAVMGTPAYMAPEQAGGMGHQVDEGADIYSLGGTLYTIVTGKLPVEGRTADEWLTATLEHRIVPPSQRLGRQSPAWVPRELEVVVLKALARRRKDRYATVEEMKAEILRYLDGATLESVDYTLSQRMQKWALRRKAAIIGGVATFAALVIGLTAVSIVQYIGSLERDHLEKQVREEADRRLHADANYQRLQAQSTADRQRLQALEAENRELAAERASLDIREREAQQQAAEYHAHIEFLNRQPYGDPRRNANIAIEEFLTNRRTAIADGATTWQFADITRNKIDDAIAAYSRLMSANETDGAEVVPLSPDDFFYWALLVYYGQRDWERADAIAAIAISHRPDFIEAIFLRGAINVNLRRSYEVRNHCTRVLEIAPDFVPAYVLRGIAFVLISEFPKAMADFDRVVELDPDHPLPYFNRSFLKYRQSDFAGAAADSSAALQRDPTMAISFLRRALAKYHLNDPAGALADIETALEHEPEQWRRWLEIPSVSAFPSAECEVYPAQFAVWTNTGLLRRYTPDPAMVFALQHVYRRVDPSDRSRVASSIRYIGGTVPTD